MTTIQGNDAQINKDKQVVIDFLSNMENFEKLLPEDKISDFVGSAQSCSFRIQKAATIAMEIKEVTEQTMHFSSKSPTPFKFDLKLEFLDQPSGCIVKQVCTADLNPMLKMMIEKPLRKLFDFIADRLTAELN